MKTSELVPGRCYCFQYQAPVEMVAKRNGNDNPLVDCQVSVERVCRVRAAGDKTYRNAMLAQNPDWQPSEKPSWHVATENPCIRTHCKDNSRKYLRAIPLAIQREQYFIGSQPADATETDIIRAFKKGGTKDEAPAFVMFALDNIANLVDDGGESE